MNDLKTKSNTLLNLRPATDTVSHDDVLSVVPAKLTTHDCMYVCMCNVFVFVTHACVCASVFAFVCRWC